MLSHAFDLPNLAFDRRVYSKSDAGSNAAVSPVLPGRALRAAAAAGLGVIEGERVAALLRGMDRLKGTATGRLSGRS
jgi:hypothetical protein